MFSSSGRDGDDPVLTYRIARGAFRRWYIFHPTDWCLAWSGSRWVPTIDGIPTGGVQVCNFETEAQAREYAERGLAGGAGAR
jgi:hypothetical protein